MSFALGRVRLLTSASSSSASSLLRPTTATLSAFNSTQSMTNVASRAFATGQSVLSAPPLKSTKDGSEVKMNELFGKKRVVVFGVVGAFTTTCQSSHVPLYVEAVEDLKEKKVDEIVCVTVNDRFVADAWKKELKLDDNDIKLLIDPDASFTKALGLELDLSAVGLGLRSKRYSILVEDGVIKLENVAKNAAAVESTGPDAILKMSALSSLAQSGSTPSSARRQRRVEIDASLLPTEMRECNACKTWLSGSVVASGALAYHAQCFKCRECGLEIDSEYHRTANAQLTCWPCYSAQQQLSATASTSHVAMATASASPSASASPIASPRDAASPRSPSLTRNRMESAAMLHFFEFGVAVVKDAGIAGGEPLFAVKFTSQRGDRCQIARRAAEVLELDAALRVSFGQGLMLPKLGRSFARRTLAASSKRRTSLSSSGSVTPSLPPQPAPALTSSSSMPATIGADAASSPPGSPLIGVDEAAQLAAMSSALEKYLIALNSMPGVATCAELYDFLGIAETMTETDWHHLFEGTRQLHFAPNTLVLVEEEPNDHLFYIVDGAVAIERGSLQLQLLRQGSFFGEISAFLGQPNSSATVVARLVDRQGKLVEPERIDPSATAVTLCALPRDELTRRLVADPALGRRFAATVTLRLDQLLVALPLARVVGAQAKAVTDDEHTRRVAFQRMFHLTRHDTILHSYTCAYARGVRTYHGELIISERCVTYAAKLFGSELQLKFYYASTSAIQCDDSTLTIKVDDQQVVFRFAQASEASNAHSNLRRRVTLQRELSRDKRRNTASPQLSRVNSSGEFPSPRSLDVTPRVRSPLSPSTSVSDVGASVAATASSPAIITDEAAAGADTLELEERYWQRLASSATEVKCKSGQVLQKANESVSFLVQVVHGTLRLEHDHSLRVSGGGGLHVTTLTSEPLEPGDIASMTAHGEPDSTDYMLGLLRDGELFGARAFYSREPTSVRLVAEQAGTVVRRIALADAWRVFGKRPLLELRFGRSLAKGVAQRLARRELELMAAAQLDPMVPLYYRVAVHRGSEAVHEARDCYVFRVPPSVTLGHFHKQLQNTAHRDLGLPPGVAIALLGDTAAKKAAANAGDDADCVYLSVSSVQRVAPDAFETSIAVPGTGGADGNDMRTLWRRRVVYFIASPGVDRLNTTTDVMAVPDRPTSPSSYFAAVAASRGQGKSKSARDDDSVSSSSSSGGGTTVVKRKVRVRHHSRDETATSAVPPLRLAASPSDRTYSGCVRVDRIETTLLSPIAGAADMMRRRVQELSDELRMHPPRVNRLQQLLQGTVAPTVNAGVLSVCDTFLDDAYIESCATATAAGDVDDDGFQDAVDASSESSDGDVAAPASNGKSSQHALVETKRDALRERAALCKVLRVFLAQCRACVELSADVIAERNLQQFRSFQTMIELKYADVSASLVAQLKRVDGGRSGDAALLWPVRRLTETEAQAKRTELEELLMRRETLRQIIEDIEVQFGDKPKPRESLETIVAIGLEIDRLQPSIEAARSTLQSLYISATK